MNWKEFLALLVCWGAFVNVGYYVSAVLRKKIRPHVFSWVIWATTEIIGASAQLADGGGVGAWTVMLSGCGCALIAILSLFYHGERNITRGDWVSFLLALCAIPFWVATSNPLWAAVFVSVADTFGFFPTCRKSWSAPREESLFMYAISSVGFLLVLGALENYSWTTALYPSVSFVSDVVLVTIIVSRRALLTPRFA